jgi:hypothetical protein
LYWFYVDNIPLLVLPNVFISSTGGCNTLIFIDRGKKTKGESVKEHLASKQNKAPYHTYTHAKKI